MNNTIFTILMIIIILPMIISTGVAIVLFKRKRKGRRTPLTNSLLRSPGETLREELETHADKTWDYVWAMILSGFLPVLLLLGLIRLGDKSAISLYWQLAVCVVFYVAIIVWHTRRLYRFFLIWQKLRLGLDAEMAVGQELNHLMSHGCRVFHDFPAEKFNIDHIVIGPGGVVAVETKGRAKPDQGGGSAEAKVIVNGDYLRFPYFRDRNFVKQARRQAEWLQKWLSSAVGQAVTVRPALALPGWFVETAKASDVIVFNGKSPFFLANPKFTRNTLSEEMIQRIAHQLEQRCRDVEPVAYRKEKPKK